MLIIIYCGGALFLSCVFKVLDASCVSISVVSLDLGTVAWGRFCMLLVFVSLSLDS